jgi:hypothetical protein
MSKALQLTLTALRVRLFQVAEHLLAGRADRAFLTQRGAAEPLVLLRASALTALEGELATLRARVAPEPRPLLGLATATQSVEDMVAAIRRDATTDAERREREYAPASRRPGRVAEPASRSRATRRKRR